MTVAALALGHTAESRHAPTGLCKAKVLGMQESLLRRACYLHKRKLAAWKRIVELIQLDPGSSHNLISPRSQD